MTKNNGASRVGARPGKASPESVATTDAPETTAVDGDRRRAFDAGQAFLLGCLLLCALFVAASYRMDEASSYLLPRGLGVVGIVCVVFALGRGLTGSRPIANVDERRGVHVVVSVAFSVVYFCLVPLLGFVIATAAAIVAFSYVMSYPRKKVVAILAVVVPVVLHLGFAGLLNAPLPTGLAGVLPF